MRLPALTALLTFTAISFAQVPPGFEKVDKEITLKTIEGKMVYDVASFDVKPGSTLKLTLENPDNLQHNIILCHPAKDGKNDNGLEVVNAAMALGAEGFEKGYIPDGHPRILAHTKMVNPKQSDTIYVKIPKQAGVYPYVCSFPGHNFLMKGIMNVGSNASGVRDMQFAAYEGGWSKLPDFDALKPYKTGPVKNNKLGLKVAEKSENFAMVWTGSFVAGQAGDYTFTLSSDDGSKLWLDGKVVVDNDGIHGVQTKTGKVKLKAGEHPIKVAYFEKAGGEEFYFAGKGPGLKQTNFSTGSKGGGGAAASGYPIGPVNGEAVMYRNFIDGGGPRAIAVGLPEGLNYCFDANTMRIAMIWQAAFMDGAKHWNGRGQGFQPPAGDAVIRFETGKGVAPLAALSAIDAAWPNELQPGEPANRPVGFQFRGYRLDKKRQPTFMYDFGELKITDFTRVKTLGEIGLTRTITITGSRPSQPLFLDLAQGDLRAEGKGFVMDDSALLHIEGAEQVAIHGGRLVAAVGKSGVITVTYKWAR